MRSGAACVMACAVADHALSPMPLVARTWKS